MTKKSKSSDGMGFNKVFITYEMNNGKNSDCRFFKCSNEAHEYANSQENKTIFLGEIINPYIYKKVKRYAD